MRRPLTAAAVTLLIASPAFADMRPGIYQITASAPGMPQPQTQSQCMTPQDARDPITPMVTGGDPNCTFSNKAQTATRVTFDYACQAQGQTVTGHVDFAMAADSFQGTIMANGNTPQGPRTVTTTLSARRTGDCR